MKLFGDPEKAKEQFKTGKYQITYAEIAGTWASGPETLVNGEGRKKKVPGQVGITVRWGCSHIGFGEMNVRQFSDGTIKIDSENMDRDFCKAVLMKLVDEAKTCS